MQEHVGSGASTTEQPALALDRFIPYRLSALAEAVSQALAAIYRDRFDLTRPEWRVLATLAEEGGLPAVEVGRRTALDKMQVSRAVRVLARKGDVAVRPDQSDKRHRRLQLTAQGRRLYERIAPLALEREASLLSVLSQAERHALFDIIDRLAAEAGRLRQEVG